MLEHPEHDQGGLEHDQGDRPEHGWGLSPSSSTFIKTAYKNGGQEDQRISGGEWMIFTGCCVCVFLASGSEVGFCKA